jgi:type IV pilus assembly protein PilP
MTTTWMRKAQTLLFSALLSLWCLPLAQAQEQGNENAVLTLEAEDKARQRFEYMLENRADPFVPFITERAASTTTFDPNEIVDENRPLTGMQLFEPGQLTLVALLKSGEEDLAMVQDFTGKGYLLTEGTKIGRRGVIKDITSNNVIIEETATTRAGRKIVSEVVMILKKEGEK